MEMIGVSSPNVISTLLVLIHEHQSITWTIMLIGVATHRTRFTRVVGIDFHDERRTRQRRFVGKYTMQFGKRPLRRVSINTALFECQG